MVKIIDIRRQFYELVFLQQRTDRKTQPETDARAHGPDERALQDEYVADLGRCGAKRHEHGDVLGFFHDHHDQRGDDGKGAHQHDHDQDDRHGRFFKLERREEVLVHLDPVAGIQRKPAQGPDQRFADALHSVNVRDLVLDPGHEIAFEPEDFLGFGDGYEGKGRVVFEHAGAEDADHVEENDLRRKSGG